MRAKFEIVPRPDDVGRTDAGELQASLRRDRYKDSLTSDLGLTPASTVRVRRRQTSIDGGAIALAVVAGIITFLLVVLLLLWRDGSLPRLWPDRGFDFAPKGPTTAWMSGGERQTVVSKPKPKTAGAPTTAPDQGPIDAKAEWDAVNPPPPKSEDDAESE